MKKDTMPRFPAALLATTAPLAVIGQVRADGSRSIEALLSEVRSELTKVSSDTSKVAEDALREVKRVGAMSEETKDRADKLLTAQGALSESLNQLTERLERNESQLLQLEQSGPGRHPRGGPGRQTLGEAVVSHDALKGFTGKGTVTIEVQNAITTAGNSGGSLRQPTRDPEVVMIPMQERTIRDLIPSIQVATSSVEYARQTTRTNAAAPVAEGGTKPESAYAWVLENTPVQTIAHWVPASRQAMDDLPMLQGLIDTELRYGLDIVEEAQILLGDGVSPNLDGLVPNATAYSGAREALLSDVTMIDKLRVAMLEAALNLFPADGVVLHDADWMLIETTKDTQGRYIFANPTGIAGPVIWGRRVVPSLSMTEDKFLVGAFRVAATIYDRMDTEVMISSEDRDNFVKNMLTVRAEKRLAVAVKRPASLIYGDFGNIT